METLCQRLVRIGAPAVLLALLLPGCIDNNTSLYIRQAQAPDPDDNCVVTSDPEALFFKQGLYDTGLIADIGSPGGYAASLLVGNQLQPRADEATQKVETSKVMLYEAEVELFGQDGGSLGVSYTMPTSGFVEEASGTEASYGLASVTLLPAGVALPAGQTVISRVKIYGETLGGLDVETGYWDYAIEVCDGCLPCACPEAIDSEYYKTCSPGRNETVDCRLLTCWASNYCGCPIQ